MTYCPCCGRVFNYGPVYPPSQLAQQMDFTQQWRLAQMAQMAAQQPEDGYDQYVRAQRQAKAALSRYPSGWSEPASEWDKIP